MNRIIDLHVHTAASDGSMSPSALVRHAFAMGLSAVAITDHDTVAGLPEAINAACKIGFEVVRGVEISAEFNTEMHLLGYFFRDPGLSLLKVLDDLKARRDERNPKIIRKLNDMGFDMNIGDVLAEAKGKIAGRPHIAAVMIKKGYAANVTEAFDKYLASGRPAYFKKDKLKPEEGIKEIITAGGIPVLAHPKYLNLSMENTGLLLGMLVSAGLKGIEAIYPDHSPGETADYISLAARHNLLVTGGSDFHGSFKPDIAIGKGRGNLNIPYELLERLARQGN